MKLRIWRLLRRAKAILMIFAVIFSLGFSYQLTDGLRIYHHESISGQVLFSDHTYSYQIDLYSGGENKLPEYGQNLDTEKASLLILTEAQRLGLPLDQCLQLEKFDLLFLPQKELQQRIEHLNLYPRGWIPYGLFDPLKLHPEDAKMLLASDISTELANEMFIHELTHYWYDRLCWDASWNGDEEILAQHMEKIYMEQNK